MSVIDIPDYDLMSPKQQKITSEQVALETSARKWIPNAGPQTDGYFSKANLLLYGGQGGGGKTDLLGGLALTRHKRSLIIRRQYTDLDGVIDRILSVYGTRKGYSGASPPSLRTDDGRLIQFGAGGDIDQVQTWQGQPHDFRGIDEACQLLEEVVRFLMGWVREAKMELDGSGGKQGRIVLASNPPLSAEGEWVIGVFRPWLDITHPSPAKHGELRWYVTDPDGKDFEVTGPNDIKEWNGEKYIPLSRTFIPASLGDNPFLEGTGYQATLDSLPEPMRSAIRNGNFMAARADHDWQVIPSLWIMEAQSRWKPRSPDHTPMCAIGVDVAQGGSNETVLALRHDGWFDELVSVPGKNTPLGSDVAALVIKHRRNGADVVMDMGGGYGGSAAEHLSENKIIVKGHKGARASSAKTRDEAKLGFTNKRSEVWWRFREALDPDQPGGSTIALPTDPGLFGDLASPRYTSVRHKDGMAIKLEEKKELIKRIGRSPDKGDAVVMAWSKGANIKTHGKVWRDMIKTQARPQVNRGYGHRKQIRRGV